jgi:Gas vesicle synthesis protein GvpO
VTADRKRKTTTSKTSAAKSAKSAAKSTKSTKSTSKQPAKKSSKATTKKTAAVDDAGQVPRRTTRPRASAPRAESKPRASATEVATRAAQELAQLTGKQAEAITGLERGDDGWRITVEVLEVRRIPETTDVLARYEVETDDKGGLISYRRAGRHTRGSTQED